MKRLVSGIQPTGEITLGNYIGAIKEFINLGKELKDYEFFIFIADMHAITVSHNPKELRENIKKLAAMYIACGLDVSKVNLFVQSEVIEHAMLSYIMESTAYVGEMERMIQFKEKRQAQAEGVRASLFTYPALMAADILMYDASIVPVGDDQKQHLELTRDLAIRFNNMYGKTFVVPKEYIPKVGARIKSLTEPNKKMSKSSDNPRSYILLLDELNTVRKKIKSAVTDSDMKVYYDEENKPGISNLLTIYSSLTNRSIKELEEKYKDSNYGTFKGDLAEVVVEFLKPIQERYKNIINSPLLDEILDKGRERASKLAKEKILIVKKNIGLLR